jgi:hypothetical protein
MVVRVAKVVAIVGAPLSRLGCPAWTDSARNEPVCGGPLPTGPESVSFPASVSRERRHAPRAMTFN